MSIPPPTRPPASGREPVPSFRVAPEPDQPTAAESARSEDLAQLRDRTDEIELIISGLTTFALFALPSWLFGRFAEMYTHLPLGMLISATATTVLLTGLCYGLGACFVVHLLTRSYWVGLIGLRTVFPTGIDWNRTPGIGPLTREHYRSRIPDLDRAIARADRVASSLFAVISLVTLGMLWTGMLMLAAAAIGGLVGAQIGGTNRGITVAMLGLGALAGGVPLLLWLLDAQVGARLPRLQRARGFRRVVRGLATLAGWVLPQRLILPVQLTLQSNTRPVVFVVALTFGVLAIIAIGQTRFAGWTQFTLSSEFRYIDHEALRDGIRSSHYEDRLSPVDRIRTLPMIDTFQQGGGYVPLFLPYVPVRDNPMLDRLCPADGGPRGAECLKRLWEVRLNGRVVPMEAFLATERADLNLLGLTGLVPLDDVAPGLQRLVVTWNPAGLAEGATLDNRYTEASMEYGIPFFFAPAFEQELDGRTGRTPAAGGEAPR